MNYYSKYIVDINQLNKNLFKIKNTLKDDVKFCAVVKADAYGIGLETICKALSNKVDFFAVACLKEALKIREFDKTTKILVLGLVDVGDIDECYKNNVSISVGDLDYLYKISNKKVSVHIQINTGLNRFGFKLISDFKKCLKYIKETNLKLEGVYSHFATKSSNVGFIKQQFMKFKQFKNLICDKGVICHISNSYGLTYSRNFNLDMVRSGFLMYGFMDNTIGCEPILEIKTRIIRIFTVKKGDAIGYDRSYMVYKKTTIGVVPLGYADGISRGLSNNFYVLIKGKKYKIVGYVCMDVFMVDLLGDSINVGDEVVILGKSANKQITLQDYAKILNTSPYEILLNFNFKRMQYIINKL